MTSKLKPASLVLLALLLCLILSIALGYKFRQENLQLRMEKSQLEERIKLLEAPKNKTIPIVDGVITIAARMSQRFRFVVDTAIMDNVLVRGEFTAKGSSGNDVIIHIFNDVNYTNWANGNVADSIYSSNRVTTDRFTVPIIQSGTYYLVFDNTYASDGFFTSATKVVSATVMLTYNDLLQTGR